MDALGISLVIVQLAKAYKLFDDATADLTPEEKSALWVKVQERSVLAREIWENA